MIRFRADVVSMQAAFDSIFAELLCQKALLNRPITVKNRSFLKLKI